MEDRKLVDKKSKLMMKTFDCSVCESKHEIGFVQNVNRGNVGGKGYFAFIYEGNKF